MDKNQIERERRTGRIAGIVGLIGVALFAGAGATGLAGDFRSADGFAESLAAFPGEESELLLLLAVQSAGILLFTAPMLALFGAVRERTTAIRPGLVGLCIAGPLFFAGSLLATYFAIDAAASAFDPSMVESGADMDEAARDVFLEQGAASFKNGLEFAGRLGLTFIMIYTSLHAMRTGLMTRFWGTLGMALGVGVILLGAPALLAFFLAISMMVAGFWPGGRTPAWDAGKAMPWPKPGEEPAPQREPEDELARPEDFEDSGSEGSGATALSAERPARRDNKRKRKRKQRG